MATDPVPTPAIPTIKEVIENSFATEVAKVKATIIGHLWVAAIVVSFLGFIAGAIVGHKL